MQIGVIGAGAIGGTLAALLQRAGHEVTITARGEALAAIQNTGLHLEGAWGTHSARVHGAKRLTETPDLAFICTKAHDAPEAITDNKDQLDNSTVVVVQNGLDGLKHASTLLPNSECIGALALFAASYLAPGHVRVTTAANTYLGAGNGAAPAAATRVAKVLNEVVPAYAVENFTGCQWTKLIVNQINAMPAITGASVQETIAKRQLRRIITASLQEAVRIGYRHKVHYGSIQGLNNTLLRCVAATPTFLAQSVPLLIKRRLGPTPNPGSTLQSIHRGQRTEIDYLNGAIVARAEDLGADAPINRALTQMVHEVETTGAFFTVATVTERIAAARAKAQHG